MILSLYTKVPFSENPYSHLFYTVHIDGFFFVLFSSLITLSRFFYYVSTQIRKKFAWKFWYLNAYHSLIICFQKVILIYKVDCNTITKIKRIFSFEILKKEIRALKGFEEAAIKFMGYPGTPLHHVLKKDKYLLHWYNLQIIRKSREND